MIVNYLITKIEAEREPNISPNEQIGVNTNIEVKKVEKQEQLKILRFTFELRAEFKNGNSENLGKIVIQGDIIYAGDNIDKVYDTWQNEHKLDDSVSEEILQASSNIGIIEAMGISKTLQMPSIIPLPKVTINKEESKEKKKK